MDSSDHKPMYSKNIALNDFHREKGDEITTIIGDIMKKYLWERLNQNEQLEIEAKVGVIMPSNEVKQSNDGFFSIFFHPHGLIMPEQKWNGKNLYYFTPGVSKEKFDLLIKIFTKEWERRLDSVPDIEDESKIKSYKNEFCIIDLGEKITIDRMFDDGVRVTSTENGEIIETIRKTKLKHINYFNKGRDYRITIAKEEKCDETKSQIIKNTRHKKRRSFQFKWMKFEFTETEEEDFKGNMSDPTYEIELEIIDTKFFNQYDKTIYLRLVERFIQNINSLITAVAEGEDLFYDAFCQPEFDKCYKEAYQWEVMPVVGDYLGVKSYLDKMT